MKGVEVVGKSEELKQRGNDAFRRHQFAEAVGYYTEAIMLSKDNPIYYMNRSMAYMKLKKFEDAESDASNAIRLDTNNLKALFRRGSARKQLQKWEGAQSDFDTVVRLDPKNIEAKSELSTISEIIKEEKQQQLARKPLDLQDGKSGSSEGRGKSSSVEAARKFLEQEDVIKKSTDDIKQPPVGKESIPKRFPGESGAFMREVSSRRISKTETGARGNGSNKDQQYPISGLDPQKPATIPRGAAKDQNSDSRAVRSLQNGSSKSTSATSRRKLQMNAYQFFQEFRHCSSITEDNNRILAQLDLLSSLDMSSIPAMLGSLLEPELLSELLQILQHAAQKEPTLVVDLMSVLPKCDRFETAWMFLDAKEKAVADTVISQVRITKGDGAADSVKSCWGGRLSD